MAVGILLLLWVRMSLSTTYIEGMIRCGEQSELYQRIYNDISPIILYIDTITETYKTIGFAFQTMIHLTL